jgi:hypothetical protein
MKKLLFIAVIAILQMSTINAQTTRTEVKTKPVKEEPAKIIKKEIKTIPAPPATPANNPPPTPSTAAYYLTGIKVNIYTGNDSKENLSKVGIDLFRLGWRTTNIAAASDEAIMAGYAISNSSVPEMKTGSNTQFLLKDAYSPTSEPSMYVNTMSIESIQQFGVRLKIYYWPNFILDAWKIDKVSITLEFKDTQGNLHPSLGNKTITFFNVSALLTEKNPHLICDLDKFLIPVN